jgi:HEAT repeat protein
VACALGCFPDDPAAIEVLLKLTADTDADVRDWATFGVGVQGDGDSNEIRDALMLRLADQDQDTREEAILALAKRKDRRVLPALLKLLRTPSGRAIEAASFMLDAEDERSEEDWTPEQYIAALKERFPSHQR